ncbi:4'-phosphopantetheinyl transferase superfamily protein [Enterococcus plantarum]|uniref:4'-phosphopantetheinyl transferase family protein n=1 Tax=Enterococcus plantarum TaxID=1077675 RepID=UPI001A8DFC76|nr:4'-phosphopantetheinyl transferase superfamily protein [Enterococcus plantarum]MBO0468532.1 4'-phosphopantetheinyl transferase superfamily protein [Enterococcus plantarum]
MLKLFYTRIEEAINQKEKFLNLSLSRDRNQAVTKFRFLEDKLRSILAELLITHSLNESFDNNINEFVISKNCYGKPLVTNFDNVYFNVSHSENFVICAASDGNVGIDIEKIGLSSPLNAENFFHEYEVEQLSMRTEELKKELFYKIWVLKESYLKFKGFGLTMPLNSFFVKENEGRFIVTETNKTNNCSTNLIKLKKIDVDYYLGICAESSEIDDLKYVSVDDLFLNYSESHLKPIYVSTERKSQ